MNDKWVVPLPTTEEERIEYERIGNLYWLIRMNWRWN